MKFTQDDATKMLQVMRARRDVRGNRFIPKQIEEEKLKLILEAALAAPSVGYSQPWKFIIIRDEAHKSAIRNNFQKEQKKAKEIFKDSALYHSLKLEGIQEAPVNIAVLYQPQKKDILGMTSMHKMGEYSVVCAVQNMWLMARSLNIGIGWVSILDEAKVLSTLNAPQHAQLIAYLCVGYVDTFYKESELKTLGWEREKLFEECVEFL